jgi:MFS family permease
MPEGQRSRSPWALIYALGISELVSWGVLVYAFAVFLVPMREELGWSDAELSGAYALGVVVSGIATVPAGRWLDRHGARGLMTAGTVLAVLITLAWSQVDSLAVFYALFSVAGLAMAANLYEPAFAVAAAWFTRDRAKAVLVVTIFGGLAGPVFIPLTGLLVDELGWRDALLVLAGMLTAICLPVHALMVRRPPRSESTPLKGADPSTRRRVLRSASFRWLTISLAISTAARVGVIIHLVSYLIARGFSLREATLATGGIGVLQVAGRVLTTALGARVNPIHVYSAVFTVQGLSVALLLSTTGDGGGATAAVVAFVLLYGIGFGLPELIRGVSVADYYGTSSYASINGVLGFFVTMARAAGPALGGVAVTALGGYTLVLVGAGIGSLLSAAGLLAADRAHDREASSTLRASAS